MNAIQDIAANVRLLALDVDGVLTDGRIYYGNDGEELKAFNIKDGLGIKLLRKSGVKVAIITGRQSEIVARRARELGIEDVVQGRDDKREALLELCQRHQLTIEECAYMGDDLPDLGAVVAVGLGLTVADAADAVREAADWISESAGGCGAVREACEFILTARGEWPERVAGYRP
jgi:3-deoxy-D-manno-octulosonate 8-phosphate phosphatase (KDO 8-P phosphatase)